MSVQEHARFFAQAGAKGIVISARRLEKLEELKKEIESSYPNTEVVPIQCDLTSESDVANLWDTTISKFGTVDVVIACAASRSQMKKIGETDIAGWWSDFVSPIYISLECLN